MPGAALDTVDGDDFTGTVKVKLGPIGLTYKGKASFVEKDEAAHRAVIDAQGRDARGNGTATAKVTATLTEQGGETKVDVVTDLDITGKPAQFGRGVMVDVGNKLIGQFADCLAGKLSGGGDAEPAERRPSRIRRGGRTARAAPAKKATAAKKAPAKSATAAKKAPAKKPAAARRPRRRPRPHRRRRLPSTRRRRDAARAVDERRRRAALRPRQPAARRRPTPQPDPARRARRAAAHDGPRRIAPTEVEPIDLLEHAGPAVAKRLAPVVAAIVLLLIILRLRRR